VRRPAQHGWRRDRHRDRCRWRRERLRRIDLADGGLDEGRRCGGLGAVANRFRRDGWRAACHVDSAVEVHCTVEVDGAAEGVDACERVVSACPRRVTIDQLPVAGGQVGGERARRVGDNADVGVVRFGDEVIYGLRRRRQPIAARRPLADERDGAGTQGLGANTAVVEPAVGPLDELGEVDAGVDRRLVAGEVACDLVGRERIRRVIRLECDVVVRGFGLCGKSHLAPRSAPRMGSAVHGSAFSLGWRCNSARIHPVRGETKVWPKGPTGSCGGPESLHLTGATRVYHASDCNIGK
jgi:hypothetical protein